MGREQARLTRVESNRKLTLKVAVALEKRLNHASRQIFRAKHGAQTR